MPIYTFQLSRLTSMQTRSRRNDVNVVTHGVLVNGRDHGYYTSVVPMWKNTSLTHDEIFNRPTKDHGPPSQQGIRRGWEVGPVEVLPGDDVAVITTVTNIADDPGLAHQHAVDDLSMKFLNIYYSWMIGNFVSSYGLSPVVEFIGKGSKAVGAVAAFLANPVGTLLGYERSGPCNGLVAIQELRFTAKQLEALEFQPELARMPKVIPGLVVERATVTTTYVSSEHHNADGCGAPAQSRLEVSVRRYPYWSWKYFTWDYRRAAMTHTSFRSLAPSGGSLKAGAGVRL